MNYLHGFHAGNHADVLKHMVLLALLARLKQKEKPFFVLDTHAGRGQYLIQGEQARKTDEARGGIFKLIVLKKLPEVLNNYLKQVERVNPVGGLINYPGSPLLIAQQLRDSDRLVCVEMQKGEADALKQLALRVKPGGSLLITELCSHNQRWAREACGDLWLGFEQDDLARWAAAAGLDNGESLYVGLRNGFQIQVRHFAKPSITHGLRAATTGHQQEPAR
jgi:hypothetical protein